MNDTDRAQALADRTWEELLEREPTFATAIGDERYDDRLPDIGEAGRAISETRNRAALDELATIDRAALDVTLRTTMDVLEAIATQALTGVELRTDRLYVVNHFIGPGVLLGDIASIQRTDTPEHLDRYEQRLRALPGYLEACAEIAREGIATGVVSPRIVVERAVAQVERIVASSADDSPPLAAVAEDDGAARERIAGVWTDVVAPAFARYLEVLRDYLPHAAEDHAVTALPGGDAIYAAEIRSWTTLPLDPQEVHDLGNERWEAIQAERFEIAARLGYPDPDTAITDRRASGQDTPATVEALIELVESQVQRSWDIAPEWFGRLPKANCRVREIEAYRAADMALAFYMPPTADGERPGTYYINTHDLPGKALHQIASVTYHEANPGHHFQIALEMEFDDRPAMRRFGGLLAGASFAEGWGSTASASPTTWGCTSTIGSGWGCWRRRPTGPPA